ncbi:MAG: hypothetical protein U9Q16_01810, partial [Patescibacteria group bacterium]|nr:hypothetical protein [Patescibacteria group bacterium]
KEIMAMHAFGIMLKPSKKNIVAGAIGTTAQQTVDKQFGHPRSYIFEVYVENNKGFKVDEYGIERIQKIFLRGDLDDKELRSIAQAINPEVEKNIAIIYFTKHPFLSKALLRIAFKSGYFEKNSGKIYLFISKFKKEIERKITITNNQ